MRVSSSTADFVGGKPKAAFSFHPRKPLLTIEERSKASRWTPHLLLNSTKFFEIDHNWHKQRTMLPVLLLASLAGTSVANTLRWSDL